MPSTARLISTRRASDCAARPVPCPAAFRGSSGAVRGVFFSPCAFFPLRAGFLWSGRAFCGLGGLFIVTGELFAVAGALFAVRGRFFLSGGVFCRRGRAFCRYGGAFSAPGDFAAGGARCGSVKSGSRALRCGFLWRWPRPGFAGGFRRRLAGERGRSGCAGGFRGLPRDLFPGRSGRRGRGARRRR